MTTQETTVAPAINSTPKKYVAKPDEEAYHKAVNDLQKTIDGLKSKLVPFKQLNLD